jgi:hypothetical protein
MITKPCFCKRKAKCKRSTKFFVSSRKITSYLFLKKKKIDYPEGGEEGWTRSIHRFDSVNENIYRIFIEYL